MVFEELALKVQSSCDGLGRFDVALPSIDDRNITKPQWNNTAGKDVNHIRTRIPV